ncbi:MAG: hypothetical protein ABSF12_21105 [Bryobacteraceae bacterium]|jgi:hypothetical protein
MRIALTLFGFIATIVPLGATMAPPSQTNASEQLVIEVISVKVVLQDGVPTVKAQAKVTDVTKSKAGLKPGQLILIHYASPSEPLPTANLDGPQRARVSCGSGSTPQLLKLARKGRYKAFLEKSDDGSFILGARYRSFEAI